MTTCPFCAETIQDAAVVCKHCGRNLPRAKGQAKPPRYSFLQITGFVVVGALLIGVLTVLGIVANRPDPKLARQRQSRVDGFANSGLLVNRECVGNSAKVNPSRWRRLDAEDRLEITQTIALSCKDLGYSARMTILDAESGQRLAEYDGGSYRGF